MVYNSRDSFYKTPFGAVEAGTEVRFAITPPRDWAVSAVFLHVEFEFDRETVEIPMGWAGLSGARDLYRAVLPTGDRLGPAWYYFRLESPGRPSFYYGNNDRGSGGEGARRDEPGRAFQLTVYAKNDTPAWYGAGVTYHIFPDRFRRTKTPNPKGMIGNRIVHKNWEDVPVFLPEENGEITNRDFFGGSIAGVREKLLYLNSLGVNTIYFSPVFEAASNHRYDTADYHKIDPMFGTEEEFRALCAQAASLGIRVILDGVFSHTGYDSRYFNARGSYDSVGAHQSQVSPYFSWYDFREWPFQYSSWWGIYTLPQVNESCPAYIDFVVGGRDSVIRHWLRAGASGWRLDVADELPDDFIVRLRETLREENPDAVLIGEVWEDASNKISYDVRRRYFLGRELHGVMNYPLRNALLSYLLGGFAEDFRDAMESLRENYPRDAYISLMNSLGTHDTPRVLTVLGAQGHEYNLPREEKAVFQLSPERYRLAAARLKLGALILFCFPGSPCVYYGDEAGLQGFEDPFNRRGYPWGHEDHDLLAWYTLLGQARNEHRCLQAGEIQYLYAQGPLLVFARETEEETALIVANRGDAPHEATFSWSGGIISDLFGRRLSPVGGKLTLTIPALSGNVYFTARKLPRKRR